MSTLKDFLYKRDIGVRSTGHELHIGVSFSEHLAAVAEVLSHEAWHLPTIGFGSGIAGPVLGMAAVFMALGSPYNEAREEIQNEAVASGFSQGFVAGLLNMSPQTVKALFGQHGVGHRNPMDPQADVPKMKARNRGLIAGYALANQASADDKKAYLSEIRQFTGHVPAGAWGDRDKIDYVITYAAKLRLHFLQ